MNPEPKLGIVKMIDHANQFGIIAEEQEGLYQSGGESVTFDIDAETQYLREGQLVKFVKEDGAIGPRATRIAALK